MNKNLYRVGKWVPAENKFEFADDPFTGLDQARARAATQRLQEPEPWFAVFDENGNMIENEAGKLLR